MAVTTLKYFTLTKMEALPIKRLYSILNDKDFVMGVVSPLDGEYEMKQIIDYIEEHKDVTPAQLLLLALSIDKDRNKDFIVELNLNDEIDKK